MNTKKFFKIIFLPLVALIAFSSCITNTMPTASSSFPLANSSDTKISNIQLSLLTSPDGYSDKTSNSKGFYSLINIYPNSCNIIFTDFDSCEQIFLCNKPECAHNTKACSSLIEIEFLNPGIVCTEKNLFIFYCDEKSSVNSQRIEKRDLTGDNPQTIYEIPSHQRLSGGIAADNDNLYFIALSAEANGIKSELLQLNYNTNTIANLQALSDNNYIIGISEKELVIKNINNADFNDQKHIINTFNVDTKKFSKDIYSWQQGEKLVTVSNGKLYYLDFPNSLLGIFSFANSNDAKIEISISDNADNVLIDGVYNNNLIIKQIDGMVDENTLIVNSYSINTTSGNVSKIDLTDKATNRPIQVLAQYKTNFFVQSTTKETIVTLQGPDGVSFQQPVFTFEYALIPQSDYYNSIENYKNIDSAILHIS